MSKIPRGLLVAAAGAILFVAVNWFILRQVEEITGVAPVSSGKKMASEGQAVLAAPAPAPASTIIHPKRHIRPPPNLPLVPEEAAKKEKSNGPALVQ